MSNSRLEALKKLQKENDLLKSFFNWNYDIAPKGVQYHLKFKMNLVDSISLVLDTLIGDCIKRRNMDEIEKVLGIDIIEFIQFHNQLKVFKKNELPIIRRLNEWTKYNRFLKSLSQRRLAALYVYGNTDDFKWPIPPKSKKRSHTSKVNYDHYGNDNYGNYNAGYDNNNSWVDVYGKGDEAETAFWNTD